MLKPVNTEKLNSRAKSQLSVKSARNSPGNFKTQYTARKKTSTRRTPRESATYVFTRWLRNAVRIDFVVDELIGNYGWSQKDKNLFYEIVYGTVKWQGRLRWIINQLTERFDNNPESARAAAYIGAYQILFLDRVPDFAAVHSIVEIVKAKHDQGTAGWINALLRRLCRESEYWKIALPESLNKYDRLSVEHSFPGWMIERWSKMLEPEHLTEFLRWSNRSPEVIFRVNRQQASREKVIGFLEKDEIQHKISSFDPWYIILEHSGNIARVESVRKGLVVIQDHAQCIAAKLLNPQTGEKILDLCAAPGGKAGHLAELCPKAEIVATDRSEDRLVKVSDLIIRCRYENLKVLQYQEVLSSSDKYDAVLVDAPCTGTGVLARRPDLRWRQQPKNAAKMAGTQRQLLRYAAERVKIGGRIVYSTCSVEKEENDDVIDEFLNDHSGYKVVSENSPYSNKDYCEVGRITVFGPEIRGDGVFAVMMRRTK